MSHGAALTSLIGVLGVIWTVSQLYGALDVAFARIFAEAPERDMVKRTARGLFVVVLIGVAIVGFVVLVSLAGLIDAFVPGEFPIASLFIAVVRSVPFLAAIAAIVVLFIYHELPPTAPRWRSAIVPGDRGRDRDRGAQPGLRRARAAAGRRGRAGGVARVGVHRPGVVVVHLPGAALWRGLGARPR